MQIRTSAQKRKDYFFVFSVLAPVLALFVIIRFIPIIDTMVTSFYKKSMIRPGASYVGLENYQYVMTDPVFLSSLGNTAFIAVFTMFFSVLFGFFLALTVNDIRMKGMKLWQAVLFVPVIVSMVPSTLMWKMLFDYNIGIINYFINALGHRSVDWINDESIVRWPIIIVGAWKEMGYNMMIFYVGLKAISAELYESAEVDGANRRQKLRYITLPQLKPITLFILVVSLIKFIKVFTQSTVMTSGSQSSGNIFKTVVYYIYQQGFSFQSMGRASAASMILLIIVFALTWLQMQVGKER